MRKNCAQFVRDVWAGGGLIVHSFHKLVHMAGRLTVASHSLYHPIPTTKTQLVHKLSSLLTDRKPYFPTLSTWPITTTTTYI